jgi:hypothetical protein
MTGRWLAVALLSLIPLGDAHGWGQEGHSIVAEIADRRLDADTRRKIDALLASEPGLNGLHISLGSIASWADDYRADSHEETFNWHFVDIPYDRDTYVESRDCVPNPKRGDCIIKAIERVKAMLADCTASAPDRIIALKLLVHFIGDLHQPLHTISRVDPETGKDDQGGNLVLVTFLGKDKKLYDTNLHKVWDTDLIMRKVYDWGEYVRLLETLWLPGKDIAALQVGTTAAWAEAAHKAAHDVAYNYRPDHVLDEDYYRDSIPIVDRQLALAGVRLARVLTETLGPVQCK